MTKERIKVITDKLEKAMAALTTDEKLEKSRARMLREIEHKGALEALKGKEKPGKASEHHTGHKKKNPDLQKEVLNDLLMAVKQVAIANIQRNSSRLQKCEIEAILQTSKANQQRHMEQEKLLAQQAKLLQEQAACRSPSSDAGHRLSAHLQPGLGAHHTHSKAGSSRCSSQRASGSRIAELAVMSDPASPEAQMSSKAALCNETDKDCKSGGTTEKPEPMSSNLSPNSPNSPNAEGSMNVKSGSKSEENSQEFANSEEAEADSDNDSVAESSESEGYKKRKTTGISKGLLTRSLTTMRNSILD